MMNVRTGISLMLLLGMPLFTCGQLKLDLAEMLQEQQLQAVNRNLSPFDESPGAVALDAAQSDGLAVLKDVVFDGGTIEVELLGENNPGRSFIGIAFNIRDEETYEAVYFRPFNFVATEQLRKDHMVQYICHPEFTWFKLREERTGEFENEIPAPPDPDDWFKATVKVLDKHVEVYLEGKADPVLKVERLRSNESGKLGLWVGNGSSGRFRKMVLHAE